MSNYTVNSRLFSFTYDQYGIDPLLDRTNADIVNISTYMLYQVGQHERGRPDLIAYNIYGSVHLWWVIILYNGLSGYRDIVEGTTLRIPDKGPIMRSLSQNYSTDASKMKVFSI